MAEAKHRLLYYWFRKDKENNPAPPWLVNRIRANCKSVICKKTKKELTVKKETKT